MLKNFVFGLNQTNFIVVEDSLNYSGRRLWQSFIQQINSTGQHTVHVLHFEYPIQTVDSNDGGHIRLHDCFSNPRGWINGKYEDCSLLDIVKKAIGTCDSDVVIAIDSLSPLLFNCGVAQCYRDLHTLLSRPITGDIRVKQLICLVHEDFLPNRDSTILRLQHLAPTYLQVESPLKGNSGYPIVRITYKKPGGKIIKKLEQFYFDEEGRVVSSEVKLSPEIPVPVPNPVTNMDELTTFKLGLRQEEIAARSQLVLPYLKSGDSGDGGTGGGGGQVFYHPDAADDWDEEDPDDDLDV